MSVEGGIGSLRRRAMSTGMEVLGMEGEEKECEGLRLCHWCWRLSRFSLSFVCVVGTGWAGASRIGDLQGS